MCITVILLHRKQASKCHLEFDDEASVEISRRRDDFSVLCQISQTKAKESILAFGQVFSRNFGTFLFNSSHCVTVAMPSTYQRHKRELTKMPFAIDIHLSMSNCTTTFLYSNWDEERQKDCCWFFNYRPDNNF